MSSIAPDDVNKFKKPTPSFLCDLEDNIYGIEFISFEIKNYDNKRTIFRVNREDSSAAAAMPQLGASFDPDYLRKIDYNFESTVLALPRVSTILRFSVGDKPVRNFRMIERHYFKERLIKSFDFTFPFCIPNSQNEWESEYELPPLKPELVREIVDTPYGVESDSFYFVDGKLIMHNKARYRYYYTKEQEQKLGISSGSAEGKNVSGGAGGKAGKSSKSSKSASKSASKTPGSKRGK